MGGWVRHLFRCQISLTCYVEEWWCSFFRLFFIFIISILTGWKNKSHCTKRGLKILRISLSEFCLNNDNGRRKVRLGVKFLDKRFLDSCKFITDTVLQKAGRILTGIIVSGAQPIRILFSMFPFLLYLARGKGKRSIEKSLLLCIIIFSFSK